MNKELFQIIDANLNRTREGLRVCEDISRFTVTDKNIAKSLKTIRHSATKTFLNSKKVSLKQLLKTRDTKKDILKFIDFKKDHPDISDLFMANIERVKESLRVLEECSKIIDKDISHKYRKLRFGVYDIEKEAARNFRHIPGNGRRSLKR